METIFGSAAPIVGAVLKLAAYTLLGAACVWSGALGKPAIRRLALLQIAVVVPLTIFTSVLRNFDIGDPASVMLLPRWAAWVVFFAAIVVVGTWAALRLAGRRPREHRSLFALALIGNALFVPAPILLAMLPDRLDDYGIYLLAMYVPFVQVMTWTFGVTVLGGEGTSTREKLRRLVNPPMVTLALAYGIAVCPPLRAAMQPEAALWGALGAAKYLVGPLGMIILGTLLVAERPRWHGHRLDIATVCVLRGFVLPGATLAALLFFEIDPLFGLVVMLQATVPPATNLSVIATHYGGPVRRVMSTFAPSYLLSALTIPLWVGLYLALRGPII